MVVDPHEAPGEGEYLAEGDEDAAVYDPGRGDTYSCCEQCAPEGTHCHGEEELAVRRHTLARTRSHTAFCTCFVS